MRAIIFGALLWLVPSAANAQLARAPQQTNVAFEASNPNGMLVVAEDVGTASEAGRFRFVRIDTEARRVLDRIDVEVGQGRGQILFGRRPESAVVTNVFHYAIVPPGNYALVYLDGSGTNSVTHTSRYVCFAGAASIYSVGAGQITVVRAPNRPGYDFYRSNAWVRTTLRGSPPGTTVEYLRSIEKAEVDFAEIIATNPLLTAPHVFAAATGTLAFEAPPRAQIESCVPQDGFDLAAAQ